MSVKGRFRGPAVRFFEKVVAGEDGCWIWAGGIASTYGRFFLNAQAGLNDYVLHGGPTGLLRVSRALTRE